MRYFFDCFFFNMELTMSDAINRKTTRQNFSVANDKGSYLTGAMYSLRSV